MIKHTLIAALLAGSLSLAHAQQPQQYTVGTHNLQNLPANAPLMPANAAKARSRIPVNTLDLRNGSARVSGSVRGLQAAVYRFHAPAGSIVRITHNNSTRQIDAGVFRPQDGRRFADGQVLPEGGEYELRIVNIRKDAARNKKARRYNFTFSLQGGSHLGVDTPVQTGPADIYSRHGNVQNGPTHWWSKAELAEREPNITGIAAFFVPSTGIVSYRQISEKMAEHLQKDGMDIRYNHPVSAISEDTHGITVQAGDTTIRARYIIACAGLHADRIAALGGLNPDFRICPFRGEYYQLPEKHNHIVKHLIYPVPEPGVPFLGVHLTRMIDGSVTVGPSAVLAMARKGYRKRDIHPRELLEMLAYPGIRKVLRANWRHGIKEQYNAWNKRGYLREVQKYCPHITLDDLKPYPAGVRAQAVSADGKLVEDFHWLRSARSLHVCNAPSPAATSAIPIGREIIAQIATDLQKL